LAEPFALKKNLECPDFFKKTFLVPFCELEYFGHVMKNYFIIGAMFLLGTLACAQAEGDDMANGYEEIVLGGGCFWCVEAVYERLDGIQNAVSGYAGGTVANPTYRQVTTGSTGHAEVVKITYDPSVISLEEVLDWFWKAHDPTTLNRQGADIGTQYRSAIYYYNDQQKAVVEGSIKKAQEDFSRPIVTEVKAMGEFYAAEDYHQDYYANNPNYGYCQVVIEPKLRKLGIDSLY
jgi:peptide-methionine (S)-S-oxide reductase